MLRPRSVLPLVVLVAAACTTATSIPATPIFRTDRVADCEPDECGPGYAVTARSSVEDDSVIAVNVVVESGSSRVAMADIARGFRSRHDGTRVIVNFLSEEAGGERFAFGLLPSRDEPIDVPGDAPSWLATVDFRRATGVTARWWVAPDRP